MKREETLKVLNRILRKKEDDMEQLMESINALRIAIREVESADDDGTTTPQKGTYKQELTDAMDHILAEYGPLHRTVILDKLQARGHHVGGGVRTVGAYLSLDDRFKNVGKGIWGLAASPENPVLSRNGHVKQFEFVVASTCT